MTVYLPFVVPSAYPCVRLSAKLEDAELIIRAYAVLGCMVKPIRFGASAAVKVTSNGVFVGVGMEKLIVSETWSVVPATPTYGVSLSVSRSCTLNEAAPLVPLVKESRSQSMLNVPEEPVLNTMPRLEV